MIDLAWFEEDAAEAERILDATGQRICRVIGRRTTVRFVSHLDDPIRRRTLELNEEVFGREGEVFDRQGLSEVEEDPDAMFVVVEVDGVIESCWFGYYEVPERPVVETADYVIDTALVSRRWQAHGIGRSMAAGILLLACLFGDVRRVGVVVWAEGQVERLVAFYRQLGFVDAPCPGSPHRCLVVDIDAGHAAVWREILRPSTRW